METFTTSYGLITLYKNETYIINNFKKGSYWDIDALTQITENNFKDKMIGMKNNWWNWFYYDYEYLKNVNKNEKRK